MTSNDPVASDAPSNVYPFRRLGSVVDAEARRTPLWSLPPSSHCPLIGVCVGDERLRELLDALFNGRSELDDFALHAGAVRECATRNRVSEAIQDELDRRHVEAIDALGAITAMPALADAWVRATGIGDAAPMFWAVLTHPACGASLTEQLLRDMHLIQHRALAAIRAHVDAGERLTAENARLSAELARATHQCAQLRRMLAAPADSRPRGGRLWRRLFPGVS